MVNSRSQNSSTWITELDHMLHRTGRITNPALVLLFLFQIFKQQFILNQKQSGNVTSLRYKFQIAELKGSSTSFELINDDQAMRLI